MTATSGSVLVVCTAGNNVQLNIVTAYTTSTSVTGTVWVFGYYSA
jgi:hypothetical protein